MKKIYNKKRSNRIDKTNKKKLNKIVNEKE